MISRRLLLAAALAAPALVAAALPALAADPIVFAAASLKNALDDVAARLQGKDRQDRRHQLCRHRDARPADRTGRAGRHLLLRRHGLDGLCRRARAGRSRRRGARCSATRSSWSCRRTRRRPIAIGRAWTSPACSAPTAAWPWPMSIRCRPAATARRRWKASACGTASPTGWCSRRTCAWRSPSSPAARRRPASSTPPMPPPSRR